MRRSTKSYNCGNAKETENKQEIYGSEIGYKATKLQATIAERAKCGTFRKIKGTDGSYSVADNLVILSLKSSIFINFEHVYRIPQVSKRLFKESSLQF